MTSPLKAELQRNPLESNFLAPTFLASSVLLDLIRLPEWGRGDDFCKVNSLTALQGTMISSLLGNHAGGCFQDMS